MIIEHFIILFLLKQKPLIEYFSLVAHYSAAEGSFVTKTQQAYV